ncbi:MAG: CPBP family intramembrane metalloprotease [Flavobacteriales bacterium]|nr:CPBP family intramembrane metalloprotease [Flavobacteriales bacterium]
MVVGWEELWFRGLFLNYCNKYLSAINLSLTMGLLFMLIHLLNPDINLIKTGPTLFLAGATLTLLYFYFKNIWLPIGLHFGNNYFGSLVETNIDDHLFFGNEGYLNAIILGGLFLLFMIKSKSQTVANN